MNTYAALSSHIPLQPPRVLLLSQRNLKRHISRCVSYEFEDIICQIDDVELCAPGPNWGAKNTPFHQKLLRRTRRFRSKNILLAPPVHLKREYDVFFVLCQQPFDLLLVNSLEGWKDAALTKVCWVEELWASELKKMPTILRLLSHFDHVITSCFGSLEALKQETGSQCHYLPPGVNALRFSPFPSHPDRSIEFLSIGRRSPHLHKLLLELSEKHSFLYHYDTLNGPTTIDHDEHRFLLANLVKRSKYFLVNPAKFNVDEQANGQSEIGYRFFEGAASGAVMIGSEPQNNAFKILFHWQDAVLDAPSTFEALEGFWQDLNSSPKLTESIRRKNAYYSLLEHDWVYRWKEVLALMNLEPTEALVNRENKLKYTAESL